MKKTYLIVIIALIAAAAALLLFPYKNHKNIYIKSETKNSIVDINYPVLSKPIIDRQIKSFVDNNLKDFKKIPPPPPDDPRHYKNSLYITYEKPFISKDVAGFVFSVMTFSGGAHPNTIWTTMNFDIKSGKKILLKDICSNIPRVRGVVISKLMKVQFADEEWIKEGVTADRLNNFVFSKDGLIFYFSPYEVACYAAGVQTVNVKFSDL